MIKFSTSKCTGCGVCPNVCPQGVITLHGKQAVLTDHSSCMECGACRLNCNFQAIELTKGTGCLFAIIKEDILKISAKGAGCGCDTDDQGGCC